MTWESLGRFAPDALSEARIQLHWAAQIASAAADRWVPPRDDDGHTSFTFDHARGALVGEATEAGRAVALRVATLELFVLDGETERARLDLVGRTLAEALRWVDEALGDGVGGPRGGARVRDYTMPPHPVRDGARFVDHQAEQAELGRWIGDSEALVTSFAELDPRALRVRTWPHHFDTGSIIVLDGDRPLAEARQIGLGASPGDGHIAEPYYYVTPWPVAESVTFPPLDEGGEWFTSGFIGAVLRASALVRGGDAGTQEARARAFFREALAVAPMLIAGQES